MAFRKYDNFNLRERDQLNLRNTPFKAYQDDPEQPPYFTDKGRRGFYEGIPTTEMPPWSGMGDDGRVHYGIWTQKELEELRALPNKEDLDEMRNARIMKRIKTLKIQRAI